MDEEKDTKEILIWKIMGREKIFFFSFDSKSLDISPHAENCKKVMTSLKEEEEKEKEVWFLII